MPDFCTARIPCIPLCFLLSPTPGRTRSHPRRTNHSMGGQQSLHYTIKKPCKPQTLQTHFDQIPLSSCTHSIKHCALRIRCHQTPTRRYSHQTVAAKGLLAPQPVLGPTVIDHPPELPLVQPPKPPLVHPPEPPLFPFKFFNL